VSDEQLPPDEADVQELNSKLGNGLQTCRSVVANYRTLLCGGHPSSNDNDRQPESASDLGDR
jgi:hypothetical protein